MWWKDGFPTRVTDAPWLRRIRTGSYVFELDTEALAITQLAPVSPETPPDSQDPWKSPTPAKLNLQITLDGEKYQCQGGAKWTRSSGPRLIESGPYVQRADITDLSFVSQKGQALPFDTQFETVAWPDRLGLTLHAKLKTSQGSSPKWKSIALKISLRQGKQRWQETKTFTNNPKDPKEQWKGVSLTLDPQKNTKVSPSSPLSVEATSESGDAYRVDYDASLIRHRINLDPKTRVRTKKSNDALERISLTLGNPTSTPQTARLCFEKTGAGLRAFEGSPITGVSAILCDSQGNPSGIPVQISKNWHSSPEKPLYSGSWLHASTLLHLPPESVTKLQLVIVCGHWGGLPAASHAQLSLIGWGSNQLWEQSAIGSWGESVCYEPDQAQAGAAITDVRPLMLSYDSNKLWKWTGNVGGGDFYRLFDKDGKRVPPRSMQSIHHRTGPCLTEVTYQGLLGTEIEHRTTVSISRTDDLVRATYQLRMAVNEDTDFSRLAFFQVGSDTYNTTREKQFAVGNNDTLAKEWSASWGDNAYQTPPIELVGSHPWVSLHQGEKIRQEEKGPGANRGFIIREWKAKLGGKAAQPWIRERGIILHRRDSSIIDLVPPPGVTSLQAGDYVEATIEHLVIPDTDQLYYGPNEEFSNALSQSANTWRMVAREAKENAREINVEKGALLGKFPDVRIASENDEVAFTLANGLGFVPVTFTNLSSYRNFQVRINGEVLQQSNRKDFWQTDYDPQTKTWSQTYNLPFPSGETTKVQFGPAVPEKR